MESHKLINTVASLAAAIATLISAWVGYMAYTDSHKEPTAAQHTETAQAKQPATTLLSIAPATAATPSEPAQPETLQFGGNVGRMEASFTLSFDAQNQSVHGSYSYLARPGKTYRLQGMLTGDELSLKELTGDAQTADCSLRKTAAHCYQGKMHNTDGRILDMRICGLK